MIIRYAIAILSVSLFASPGYADKGLDVSANVTIGSEGIGRGFSITNHRLIYGGSIQASSNGMYTILYTGRFGLAGATNESYVILGYGHTKGRLTTDVSFVQYFYNSRLASDFREAAVSAHYTLGTTTIGAGVRGSTDYFAHSGRALYTYADASAPVYKSGDITISLSALLGRQEVKQNAKLGAPDYTYWKAAVAIQKGPFMVSLGYHDTDIPESLGLPAGSRLVSALSYTF